MHLVGFCATVSFNRLFSIYRIIPFVAADAVVDEPAKVYDSYQPEVEHVYNVSEIVESPTPDINIFSPPIETEGNVF